MRIVIVAALIVLVLVGCDTRVNDAKELVSQRLMYVQDPRTGICYAYEYHGFLSTVPCEKVEKFLTK